MMQNQFQDQVAIVTGAANGLGKSYALALAKLGVHVVVNDVDGARDGSGQDQSAAAKVVEEIQAQGGSALLSYADITDYTAVTQMVDDVMQRFGRIDILINNAGILRDSTFSKANLDDFWHVVDVHLKGSVHCTKAVWDVMKAQNYGRIVLTSSASGLYGNFGQTNYAVAKSALLGLMNVLDAEGKKYNIKVNLLAPTAHTRMTDELLPEAAKPLLSPEAITPATLFLAGPDAPSKTILAVGAGVYARSYIFETEGVFIPKEQRTPEIIAQHFEQISASEKRHYLNSASEQTVRFVEKAMQH